MKNYDFINYRAENWDPLRDRMHVHNGSYEILQILEGEGHFVIGGTPYPIVRGAVYFTNSVQLHCSRPDSETSYVRSKVGVNSQYLDDVLKVLGLEHLVNSLFGADGGSLVVLPAQVALDVDKRFRRMADIFASDENDANAKITLELVRVLLSCASFYTSDDGTRLHGNTLITRAVNYINANISTELTIEQIAKEIFVSKYHLCRSFKRSFGVSIMKYILSQRITLAKEQLANTDMSCSDISMMMGFSSFSYFCRVFKQQEGITPNRYRQIYGKGKKADKEQ